MNHRTTLPRFGVIALTIVAALFASENPEAVKIYWTTTDTDLQPKAPDALPHVNAIYLAQLSDAGLSDQRTILETHNPQVPEHESPLPFGLAIDRHEQRIYWAEPSPAAIETASIKVLPTQAEQLKMETGVRYPVGVALDRGGARPRVFWGEAPKDGITKLGCVAYAYATGEDRHTRHILCEDARILLINGITLVHSDDGLRVFVITYEGKLFHLKVESDGHAANLVFDGQAVKDSTSAIQSLAYVPAQRRFYWAESASQRIGFAKVNDDWSIDASSRCQVSVTYPKPICVFADLKPTPIRLYWGYRQTTGIDWAELGENGVPAPRPAKDRLDTGTTTSGIVVQHSD
jgi:hypothetical protein